MASSSLFLCLTLLSLSLSTVSSSHYSEPSFSELNSHGSLDLQGFSSFLRGFKFGSPGSRKFANGLQLGRIAAEIGGNKTAKAAAPALAPAPARGDGNLNGEKGKKEKPRAVKWVAGISLGLVTGAISAILISLLFRVINGYLRSSKPDKPVVYQRKIIDSKALAFLEGAVAKLGCLEILGRGGSGEVYKTTLENGKIVAIKRVLGLANINVAGGALDPILEKSYDLTKHSAQIRAELETLGQIRHRNLVTLLAYIPKPDGHFLIYDYMVNGSLHDALIKVAENELELPWSKRFNIARGVAMGLKYLHFDCARKIVHCDLKPGNILLDEDMEAHIGDFGLAKIIPDSMTHFTSNNLAGTVGFIAPEYYQTLRYTTKGDVYGFGVVLIVLLTGKAPTHHLFSDVHTHMGNWVVDVLVSGEEHAMAVLDSPLRGLGDEAEMLLVLKVASFCLNENPVSRPTISEVLKMLDQIRSISQPSLKIGLPLEVL